MFHLNWKEFRKIKFSQALRLTYPDAPFVILQYINLRVHGSATLDYGCIENYINKGFGCYSRYEVKYDAILVSSLMILGHWSQTGRQCGYDILLELINELGLNCQYDRDYEELNAKFLFPRIECTNGFVIDSSNRFYTKSHCIRLYKQAITRYR